MREGLDLLHQKQFAQSAARFDQLRRAGADSFQLHFYAAQALVGLGRLPRGRAAASSAPSS